MPLTLEFRPERLGEIAGFLNATGILNVQTLLKSFTWTIPDVPYQNAPFSVDIFPNLEVIRGPVAISIDGSGYLQLLPGPGLAKLRVAQQIALTGSMWGNRDLTFLPSLICPGAQYNGDAIATLTSLAGLDKVVDGNPAVLNQTCLFSFTGSPQSLFDVSALATYARCGAANQRPDNGTAPCVDVWCGQIRTWSALCSYISNGGCP